MADGIKILQSVFGPRDFTPDIHVDGAKCAALRHRRSRCRECVEMCPAGALSLEEGRIEIDHDACTHCGACTTVCPTQALESAWLPRGELLREALRALSAGRGEVAVACERAAAAPAGRGACVVTCLDRIDEALLLSLAASGACRIVLAADDCASCEIGCRGAVWTLVVEYARHLLGAVGCPTEIVMDRCARQDGDDTLASQAVSRRDALLGFGGSAARKAGEVVEGLVRDSRYGALVDALGIFGEDSPLAHASRGRVCTWALGALALRDADDAATALERLAGTRVHARMFGEPVVDMNACAHCFLCTAYCRERAIVKMKDEGKVVGLRAMPHLCNGCNVCVDVCRTGSVSIRHDVDLATILREGACDMPYENGRRAAI